LKTGVVLNLTAEGYVRLATARSSQLKLKECKYERFTKPSRSDPVVQSAGSGKREKRYDPDVTYVSLSEHNPELKAYLPWTGTHKGPEAIVKVLEGVANLGDQGLRGARRYRTG
jgi:ABC-type phosphate transport system substrate-binding protein